jgi:hypothetical protein
MVIYPNPVSNQAKLSLQMKKTSQVTVMITDIAGRTVYSPDSQLSQGNREIVLPVRALPAGIFQVIIIPEDNVMVTGKFLKTN